MIKGESMKYDVLSGIEEVPEDPIIRYHRLKSMFDEAEDLCIKYIKTKPPKGRNNGSNTKSSKSR